MPTPTDSLSPPSSWSGELHRAPDESILRSVVDGMAEGLAVVDEQGRLVLFNPMAEQLVGRVLSDTTVSDWPAHYGLFLPDQVTPFPANELPMARALRGESVSHVEMFLRNPDRPSGAWLLVSCRPIRDAAGVPRGGVAVFSDITGFKRAEKALLESEVKYRTLYNSTPVMMHSIDSQGRLVSVSDCWLSTLGYSREEVIGRDSVEFLTEDSARFAREKVLPAFFATGVCKDVPYQLVKKNGERLDVLLSAIAERDASGRWVRSLAVLLDVTERHRAEAALQQSERQLRAILDNATTVFFLIDTRGRYIFVNRQWERVFHRTREAVAGKTVHDVFPADLADRLDQVNEEVLQRRMAVTEEVRVPQVDGMHTHITQKFPLLDARGEPYAVCGISTDITERKRREEAQRFLAEASRELGTSLDSETTLQRVAELTVPRLADVCVVFMPGDGTHLRAVAVAAREPGQARRVRTSLEDHPLVPDVRHGPAGVMATGRSECLPLPRGLQGPEGTGELGDSPRSACPSRREAGTWVC